MHGSRPKDPTKSYIPYPSIFRTARLQMSRVRIDNASPSPSPSASPSPSSSKRSTNSSMDCEMDDLQHRGTTANHLPQSTAPPFHPAASPPTKTATDSGRAIERIPNNDDATSLGGTRTPVCICLTCERAAVEAKAAAASHMHLSQASRHQLDRGAVAYAC